jgi:uncharacterized protein (TIGR00645 family)
MTDHPRPDAHKTVVNPRSERIAMAIEHGVFAIRWMLVPLYVGLVAALGLYIAHFIHEVIEMFLHMGENYEKQDILMLFILELVDMSMISQLVVMTIQGGYAIFIRPLGGDGSIILPQWLKHGLGTSEQKIKLGMSIMGIMMVQLLKNYIGTSDVHTRISFDELWMRIAILASIAFATLMFCIYNRFMHPLGAHAGKDEDHN